MQKLIKVIDENTKELDEYLNSGWYIKEISACSCESNFYYSACYVVIQK